MEKYHYLTYIEEFKDKNGWKIRCKCDCGNEHIISKGNKFITKSCGCKRNYKTLDFKGQTIGHWFVLEKLKDKFSSKQVGWLCRCVCGVEKIVSGDSLRRKLSTNCGCIAKEKRRQACTKHGGHKTRIYRIAIGILQRCNNPNDTSFFNYGGRGIKCNLGENASEVYENLLSIDGYEDNLELDRIDVNGHYEIGNVRWVTSKENKLNRRCTPKVEDYEIKRIERSNFQKVCKVRGLDINDFEQVFHSKEQRPDGRKVNMYNYFIKNKDNIDKL